MIKLHVFPLTNGVQPSPPCAKVETYFRLAGLPVEIERNWDLDKAPKGKFPYIEDGDRTVADSWFILRHLENRAGGGLDGRISAEARAQGHLIQRVCDESLYYVLSYLRWLTDDGFALVREAMFGAMPEGERNAIADEIRQIARDMLHNQGYGRHDTGEIVEQGEADLAALDATLGDRRFMLGDAPSTADCSAFGWLTCALFGPASPTLAAMVRRHPRLVAYEDRIRRRIAA